MCADCAGSERRSRKRTFANAMGELQLQVMESVWFPWVMVGVWFVAFGLVAGAIEAIHLG